MVGGGELVLFSRHCVSVSGEVWRQKAVGSGNLRTNKIHVICISQSTYSGCFCVVSLMVEFKLPMLEDRVRFPDDAFFFWIPFKYFYSIEQLIFFEINLDRRPEIRRFVDWTTIWFISGPITMILQPAESTPKYPSRDGLPQRAEFDSIQRPPVPKVISTTTFRAPSPPPTIRW